MLTNRDIGAKIHWMPAPHYRPNEFRNGTIIDNNIEDYPWHIIVDYDGELIMTDEDLLYDGWL